MLFALVMIHQENVSSSNMTKDKASVNVKTAIQDPKNLIVRSGEQRGC